MFFHLVTALATLLLQSEAKHYAANSRSNSIDNDYNKPQRKLLDFGEFEFLNKPDASRVCTDDLYLLVIIHSQPENFKERELIRQTWGSVSSYNNLNVKLVFLMGQYQHQHKQKSNWLYKKSPESHDISNSIKSRSLNRNGFFKSSKFESEKYKSQSTDKLVMMESALHNDIVQGNFDDAPGNLTHKHVMGYSWVVEECHIKPAFVLKTDDNVFVEMYHLLNFLSGVYGQSPGPSIVCDVVPAGAAPHKPEHQKFLQKTLNKDLYPKYCSGSAYLITPSLMEPFLKATQEVAPVPWDDIYMMGMVREHLNISPFYLNLRYTYELGRPYKWLQKKYLQPLPFLFVVSDNKDKRSWSNTVRQLWRKSEMIHKLQIIKR